MTTKLELTLKFPDMKVPGSPVRVNIKYTYTYNHQKLKLIIKLKKEILQQQRVTE